MVTLLLSAIATSSHKTIIPTVQLRSLSESMEEPALVHFYHCNGNVDRGMGVAATFRRSQKKAVIQSSTLK